jgi:ubiquinone/menaquinone biosynthesis C-methylase UbiE
MRKDYLNDSSTTNRCESAFVEEFWTRVWEIQGGPQASPVSLSRKDEYRVIAQHLSSLPAGAEIIDGGCGLGEWVMALHKQGFKMVGMDISGRTVEQLRQVFSGASFVQGDIRKTGYPDNCFDAYYSWGVFEHFEAGPGDCIREALRILKPRGLLFISVPLDNLRQSVIGTFANPRPSITGDRFYQYRFTRAELARELSMRGFEPVSFHPIHKRQGILRSLHHEFGLPYEWFLTRAISVMLSPFVPGWWVAHMVLAVARKPED